jgi:hypothetical protein
MANGGHFAAPSVHFCWHVKGSWSQVEWLTRVPLEHSQNPETWGAMISLHGAMVGLGVP